MKKTPAILGSLALAVTLGGGWLASPALSAAAVAEVPLVSTPAAPAPETSAKPKPNIDPASMSDAARVKARSDQEREVLFTGNGIDTLTKSRTTYEGYLEDPAFPADAKENFRTIDLPAITASLTEFTTRKAQAEVNLAALDAYEAEHPVQATDKQGVKTTVTVAAPDTKTGAEVPVLVTVTKDGAPLADKPVAVSIANPNGTVEKTKVTTDEHGQATLTTKVDAAGADAISATPEGATKAQEKGTLTVTPFQGAKK